MIGIRSMVLLKVLVPIDGSSRYALAFMPTRLPMTMFRSLVVLPMKAVWMILVHVG